MGFFERLAKGVLTTVATVGVLKLIGSVLADNEEEKRRKATPCTFGGSITEAMFEDIAYDAVGKIKKRKIAATVRGPVVYGTIESQSRLSEWSFNIDFNDYGEITGEYWLTSDNSDSVIPERIASMMRDEIIKLI